MTERDIRANSLVIEEGINAMAAPESERAAEEAAAMTVKAAVALLVGFLVDVNRIADAAERRFPNAKADADTYRRG